LVYAHYFFIRSFAIIIVLIANLALSFYAGPPIRFPCGIGNQSEISYIVTKVILDVEEFVSSVVRLRV